MNVANLPGLLVDSPEFEALRARRRERLFGAMRSDDIDVLMLGRPAEVTYATGQRQLWLAGSRPFGPAAILVGATGGVHLLATSDDGVPDEFETGDLFAMSWNPANIRAAIAGLAGLATARRVATTSMVPGFERFVASVAPNAALVDGAPCFERARRRKDADEIACITRATSLAVDALATLRGALHPGVSEREVLAAYLGRLGEIGVPTPPTEGVVCANAVPFVRRVASTRRLEVGDRVVVDVGANAAGYEGGFGTTFVLGEQGALGDNEVAGDVLRVRALAMLDATIAACRPGATGAEVKRAACSTGESLAVEPIVTGMGMGIEPPVVAPGIGDAAELQAAMVVSVSAFVCDERVGGWFERRLVVVDDPPRRMGVRALDTGVIASDQPAGGAGTISEVC